MLARLPSTRFSRARVMAHPLSAVGATRLPQTRVGGRPEDPLSGAELARAPDPNGPHGCPLAAFAAFGESE